MPPAKRPSAASLALWSSCSWARSSCCVLALELGNQPLYFFGGGVDQERERVGGAAVAAARRAHFEATARDRDQYVGGGAERRLELARARNRPFTARSCSANMRRAARRAWSSEATMLTARSRAIETDEKRADRARQ